jgi:linoleoyl-CoA desaturase
VLAGSWIALYTLKPDSWKFVGLYLLNAIAQTFLLLNIAHDSNHNAISSVRSVNRALNYVFDVCGISSYMWRILHHRGHHSCINLHGEDDALTGRRILRFTPHEPRARLQRFQHIYALFLYALFSLDYVFLRDFECFFFPSHDYLKNTKHPVREYVILFAGKGFYLTYMLILPVVLLGKSPLLVALAFVLAHLIIGLSVALVFQTTHCVDSTYFPSSRSEFENGISHLRYHGRLRNHEASCRLACWRPQPPYRPSSVPFCVPHSLCFADSDCEGDRRRVWNSLSATSHNEAGDQTSSATLEAIRKRGSIFE